MGISGNNDVYIVVYSWYRVKLINDDLKHYVYFSYIKKCLRLLNLIPLLNMCHRVFVQFWRILISDWRHIAWAKQCALVKQKNVMLPVSSKWIYLYFDSYILNTCTLSKTKTSFSAIGRCCNMYILTNSGENNMLKCLQF